MGKAAVKAALQHPDVLGAGAAKRRRLNPEAGRPSELESMVGVVTRKGRELRVPTPTADMVYAALLPMELKAQRNLR